MKTLDAPVAALFAANARTGFWRAKVVTISLRNGSVLRWTDHDQDVTAPFGENTYTWRATSGLDRGPIERGLGLDVRRMRLKIWPRENWNLNGITHRRLVTGGFLRGAKIQTHDAVGPVAGEAVGCVKNLFVGEVGTARDLDDVGGIQIECESVLHQLTRVFPRGNFQSMCLNQLGDGFCRKQPASYSGTVVSAISSKPRSRFVTSLTSLAASNSLGFGRMKFTSGENAGYSRVVKFNGNTPVDPAQPWIIEVGDPFPGVVNTGDAFEVFEGCDRLLSTCESRFDNRVNYIGSDFMPAPEASL